VHSEDSPSQTGHFLSGKSPSVEVTSEGTVITEDIRSQRHQVDTMLAHLSSKERQSIFSVPAANNPEDLKLFAR